MEPGTNKEAPFASCQIHFLVLLHRSLFAFLLRVSLQIWKVYCSHFWYVDFSWTWIHNRPIFSLEIRILLWDFSTLFTGWWDSTAKSSQMHCQDTFVLWYVEILWWRLTQVHAPIHLFASNECFRSQSKSIYAIDCSHHLFLLCLLMAWNYATCLYLVSDEFHWDFSGKIGISNLA